MRSKKFKIFFGVVLTFILVATSAFLTMAVTGTEVLSPLNEQYIWNKDTAGVTDAVYADSLDKKELIRFHVIANSDSDEDQALKRRIRDVVVEQMSPVFAEVKNYEEARTIAEAHLNEIKKMAEKEVNAWGKDYPVKVELGNFDFPIKTYGEITLPAGNYEAVRIVVGEGQGANWWCVLFPPLCFVDVSREMTPAEDYPETDIAYESETQVEGEAEEVKVRFKIFEMLGLAFD